MIDILIIIFYVIPVGIVTAFALTKDRRSYSLIEYETTGKLPSLKEIILFHTLDFLTMLFCIYIPIVNIVYSYIKIKELTEKK